MAQMSNYLETQLINHVFRNTQMTTPGTVYLALYSTTPGEDDTGTELTGNGYSRKSFTLGSPTDGTSENSAEILFDTATADWTTVTHIGVRDEAVGGNLLMHQALDTAVNILSGNNFRIQTGDLAITFA